MALKGDREILQTNIRYTIESGVNAERGIVLIATENDGVGGLPNTGNTVIGVSGLGQEVLNSNLARPLGLLLGDIEDVDYTTAPQNFSRDVLPQGSEVTLLTKGRVKTNLIARGAYPAAGQIAYLAPSGWVSNAEHVAGSGIKVGFWESNTDSDGFAHLFVDIEGRAPRYF